MIALVVSAALSAAVWALSIPLTGKAEPWDAEFPYYFVALVLAGASRALSFQNMRGHTTLERYWGRLHTRWRF